MKKLISSFLCVTLLFSVLIISSAGQTARTVFYLDKGDVTIGDSAVSGYDENGSYITKTNENGYSVTQSDSSVAVEYSLTVTDGVQNIELKDLNIHRKGSHDFAVCVLDGAGADFTVSGTNHITSGPYRAAVDVAQTAVVTIQGDGVLYATSNYEAGIGGGNAKTNGTLTINSGTIYANGGVKGYSAGIGGGTAGGGGNITINGGNITAIGGANAAGIGGGNLHDGGNITINGGTVTAVGGSDGAGIGGGFKGNGGNVVINSGSVKAVAGSNAAVIGNGANCTTAFSGVRNSQNQTVSVVKVKLPAFDEVRIDSADAMPINALHEDDSNLYLYLPAGKTTAIVSTGEAVSFYEINGSAVTQIYPFADGDFTVSGGFIDCEDISDVKLNAGFSLNKKDGTQIYELVYNSNIIGRYQIQLQGDVNLDGNVNSADALMVLCFVTEKYVPDSGQRERADYNSDGKINSYDALLILKKSVGLI